MPDGGFYQRRSVSPTSLTIVLLLHAAAIGALAMSKMDVPMMKVFEPLPVKNVPLEPEPEPIPDPQPQKQVQPKQQIDYVPPIVPPMPRPSNDNVVIRPTPAIPVFTVQPGRDEVVRPVDLPPTPPLPKVDPVRVEAQMLKSSTLQPPYPPSEERAGEEGTVTVRVTIGPDGRVTRAEKVSATSDAFFRSTERHALRAWRFKPATVDGKPIESSKTITVRFQLND